MSRYVLMVKLTLSRQSSNLLRNPINSIIRLNSTSIVAFYSIYRFIELINYLLLTEDDFILLEIEAIKI